MGNKRKHSRLSLELEVEILWGGRILRGTTRNISFGGLLVQLWGEISCTKGDEFKVSLVLPGGEYVTIEFRCKVVHMLEFESCLGLQFLSIEGIESYEHFRNLMLYNSPERENLLLELEQSPGLLTG
ncbi:MAG: PilZ domain-containing protein [bacterium]|nr:PilZ domain-containing protein [bacterium]